MTTQLNRNFPNPPFPTPIYSTGEAPTMDTGWRGWFTKLLTKLSNGNQTPFTIVPVHIVPFYPTNGQNLEFEAVISGTSLIAANLIRNSVNNVNTEVTYYNNGTSGGISGTLAIVVRMSPGDGLSINYDTTMGPPIVWIIPR